MSISLNNVISGYENFILRDISLEIERGSYTALIGPNGSGKSTLFKTMARLLPLQKGVIQVGSTDINSISSRSAARIISMLPQNTVIPPGINVEQLVEYGRAPYQNFIGIKTDKDIKMVEHALEAVSIEEFKKRQLSELSGGQQQRAFLAMIIAQDTPYVLLDEPTTFLDIKHQFETLDLLKELHLKGKTCVVVLHDIAQASRYADNLVVMKEGCLHVQGKPEDVVTPEMILDVYGVNVKVYPDPVSGTPVVSPY